MPPPASKSFRNFLHSSLMMASSKHLAARRSACFGSPPFPRRESDFPQRCHFSRAYSSSSGNPDGRCSPRINSPALRTCSVRAYSQTSLARTVPVSPGQIGEVKSIAKRLEILIAKLEELGIPCHSYKLGQHTNLICPRCDGGQSKERSFSLFIREDGELALWSCFRGTCGWRGRMKTSEDVKVNNPPVHSKKPVSYTKISEEKLELEPLCSELIDWFSERTISTETLRRCGVMQKKHKIEYQNENNKEYKNEIVIAFTYRRDGNLVSCKYRASKKRFFQERNTERIFYGLDDIKNASEIIIVEGEMDKLALMEAGFPNCVSVPDGAPARVADGIPEESEDTKFQFLWNCKEYVEKASRIILATDSDKPGQALAEELARRLGKERCWRVTWPKKDDVDVFKDANEVLMYLGHDELRKAIEDAELYPIQGLFRFSSYFNEIDSYYTLRHGDELGLSTGWNGVDEYYRVVPGELTIVTGVPNSGKSEWIDALLCNLNETAGWTFALCSMENKVREHARKLLEKHIRKPFFNARYGESAERMSAEDLEQGKLWLDSTFHLIRCEDDSIPSITWVLNLAKAAVLRHGIRGLVIDPYNELDHQRNMNMTETEYVSLMLTKVKRFAQHHSCHVWFVAHPRQLQNWNGGAPTLYDISGSAHFINKCDNGVVIHRIRNEEEGPVNSVKVCVRKVRNKVAGRIGDAMLNYDCVTGVYKDFPKN